MTKVIHGGDIYRYPGELLDFSSNINPLGVPDVVIELLRGETNLERYPDIEYRALRRKIADRYQLKPEEILVGNGAVEIIFLIANLFSEQKVLLPVPTFGEYRRAVEQAGGQVEIVFRKREHNFALPLAEIEEKLPTVAGIIICNPNNPTGNLMSLDELTQLVEMTKDLQKYLIFDEAFLDFVPDPEKSTALQWLSRHPRMLIIRALTKFFAIPGLRFGYGFGGAEVISHLRNLQIPWSVNSLAAKAAELLIYDNNYIECSRDWIKRERGYFLEKLEKIFGLEVWPTAANFLLARLTTGMSAKDIKTELISHQILIRDASSFLGLDQSYFRLAIKDRASNQKLLTALKKCL